MSDYAYNREYYARNRDRLKAKAVGRYAANPAAMLDQQREYRATNPGKVKAGERMRRHGPMIAEWIGRAMAEQDGRCYLCGDPLGDRCAVDHDHSCCPQGRSCPACRRGIAVLCLATRRSASHATIPPGCAASLTISRPCWSRPGPRIAARPQQPDLFGDGTVTRQQEAPCQPPSWWHEAPAS